VPAGKALYVAIYNAEDSLLEESTPGSQTSGPSPLTQIGELRAVTAYEMDGVTDLAMQVDRENISNIRERFRMQSPPLGSRSRPIISSPQLAKDRSTQAPTFPESTMDIT